jgi:hypothetical protein
MGNKFNHTQPRFSIICKHFPTTFFRNDFCQHITGNLLVCKFPLARTVEKEKNSENICLSAQRALARRESGPENPKKKYSPSFAGRHEGHFHQELVVR